MATEVNFRRGNKANMPSNLVDGMLTVTKDTNEIFMDTSSERTPLGVIRGEAEGSELHNDIKNNKATHQNSSASGSNTTTSRQNQTVIGEYNFPHDNSLFEVGNGSSKGVGNIIRSNAFVVFEDGHAEVSSMGATNNSVATKEYVDSKAGGGTQPAISSGIVTCTLVGANRMNFNVDMPSIGTVLVALLVDTGTFKMSDDGVPHATFNGQGFVDFKTSHYTLNNLEQYSLFAVYINSSSEMTFLGTLNSIDDGSL